MSISVAIATFNRAAMVAEAVMAALAQANPDDEIVVSDDASTDDTPQVLADLGFSDLRVRVLRRDVNTGGVANWNAAMDATRGEFIAWCSDDDRFLPGHLDASVSYLESHPQIGMVHSSFIDTWETPLETAKEARRLRSGQPLVLGRQNLFCYLARYYDWPFHPSTLVMRREVWEQTGPFDAAYALADTDWFVRVAERFQVALLPRHGVLNRRHAGNWSNRVGSARMQAEIFQIVERAIIRRWPRGGPRRILWRAIWRANVRLRLLLTVWARVRSGHGNAAGDAWRALTRDTGNSALALLDRPGQTWFRRRAARHAGGFGEPRQSVSPL